MKTLRCFVQIIFCIAIPLVVSGQTSYPLELGNNCEENASTFWVRKEFFDNAQKIFVISRLGKTETLKGLNQSRIKAVFTELTIGGIPKVRIVTAVGTRTNNKGRVEIYANGDLLLAFEIGKNERLLLRNCLFETAKPSRKYFKIKKLH